MKPTVTECLSEGVIVNPEVIIVCHSDTGTNIASLHDHNLTTFLLLESLTEPVPTGDSSEKPSADLQAIEAKLELLIQLVTQLLGRQQTLPSPQTVRLSGEGIEWQSQESPPSQALLEIFLEPRFCRSIKLPVENRILDEQHVAGYRVCSRFRSIDSALQDHLEKWVFRCHRRAVALQRHTRQAESE